MHKTLICFALILVSPFHISHELIESELGASSTFNVSHKGTVHTANFFGIIKKLMSVVFGENKMSLLVRRMVCTNFGKNNIAHREVSQH